MCDDTVLIMIHDHDHDRAIEEVLVHACIDCAFHIKSIVTLRRGCAGGRRERVNRW